MRHRLDDGERVALHQHAVLERARLGLVGVADQVVGARRLRADRLPLAAGREGRAAAPDQAGCGHLRDDAGRSELDGPAQRRVPAVGAVGRRCSSGSTRPTRRSSTSESSPGLRHGGSRRRLGARRATAAQALIVDRGHGAGDRASHAARRRRSPARPAPARTARGTADGVRAGGQIGGVGRRPPFGVGRRGRCRRAPGAGRAARARTGRRSWRRRRPRPGGRRAAGDVVERAVG